MAKYLDATGVSTLWSKVKDYGTTTAAAAVKTITDTKGAPRGIASLDSNGNVPLNQLGNLDTTFAEVVTALPTSGIKKHLYLVKSSDTSQNLYSEYLYTGDVSATYDASKWEKLGEYKADVDLSGYAKKYEAVSEIITNFNTKDGHYWITGNDSDGAALTFATISPATTTEGGIMSAADKTKLDGIASGANKYSLPTASASTLGGVKVGNNLSISAEGVLSGTADTHYSSKNVVATSANGTTNGSTSGTVYLNHIETTGCTSSHAIKSGANVLVSSDDNGNITIQSANTNTYVNKAAFTGNDETVTMTLTLNDGSTVTANIPAVAAKTNAGVVSKAFAENIGLGLIKLNGIDYSATADSAITATELAAILV